MDKNIVYVDSLTTYGLKCPELIVHATIEIKNQNVIHYEDSNTIFLATIRLAISYKIIDAKLNLDELKNEKSNIVHTKNHIKTLKNIIHLMNKFNKTFEDKNLRYLYAIDGCTEERGIAQESYARNLKNAEKILVKQVKNYKTTKKYIHKKCLEEVSMLLKSNGLKNHKDSAFVILRDNGLDIPTYL